MKKTFLIILTMLFMISCKEKRDDSKLKKQVIKPNLFLSFTSEMSDNEFQVTISNENRNKNLINDNFILNIIDKKFIFKLSRNSKSIELTSEAYKVLNSKKYIDELLNIFKSKYENVETLYLPIYSAYNKKENEYIYNWIGNIQRFRGKETKSLSYYKFKQLIYYKAFSLKSEKVVLIGYSAKTSDTGLEEFIGTNSDNSQLQNEKIRAINLEKIHSMDLQDLTITLNYFNKVDFESWVENIEREYNEFYEFKNNELEKDRILDSITTSNIDKI